MSVSTLVRVWSASIVVVVVALQGTSVQTQQRGGTVQTDKVPPVNSGANPYRVVRDWARLDREARPWGGSNGVAIDRDGKSVWATDRCSPGTTPGCLGTNANPVHLFDESGKEIRSFGGGMFVWPHGIHVDRNGNVWVTDARAASPEELKKFPGEGNKGSVVVKFSPEGKILMTLGRPGVRGNPPEALTDPTDVVTDSGNGDVYVAESHTNVTDPNLVARVSVFDRNGKFLRVIGKTGTGPGEFRTPHALEFDSKGQLVVADRHNHRIQILTKQGKPVSEHDDFGRISGLAIDKDDVIYTADSESSDNVHPGWQRGIRIGSLKDGKVTVFIPPHMAPNAPDGAMGEGIAIDAAGNIYTAEAQLRGVTKYIKQSPPRAQAVDEHGAPIFKVDPFWPKPLPNKWSMQQVTGIHVDDSDHIWFLNRAAAAEGDETGGDGNPPRIDCCVRGPEVVALDQDGKVVHAWGGPGYHPLWPTALQTVIADRQGFVWVGGTAPQDSILKFTRDGKFVWDFGHRPPAGGQLPENNQQTDVLASKGRFQLDEVAREIYIINWKRLLVYDMDTGAFKRGWGGHGMPLSEISNAPIPPYKWTGAPPPAEKNFVPDLHFVEISRDRRVYVGERGQNRIEVFTTEGRWLEDFSVAPNTPARGDGCGGLNNTKMPPCGTTYKLAISRDPAQKYLYVADGTNNRVWMLDRQSGKTLGSFGGNGRYAGQLHWINAIAMDSMGNIYTGEVEQAKRIQKFEPVHP